LDDDTTLSGIIDRLDAKGDTLYINDYKTNQKINPDDHDTHEEQLTLY
jgi:RecB family exonuclease